MGILSKNQNDKNSNLINTQDRLGRTCFHMLCQYGAPTTLLAQVLDECRAISTLEDIEGQSALHYAIDANNDDIVIWFINRFGFSLCLDGLTQASSNLSFLTDTEPRLVIR